MCTWEYTISGHHIDHVVVCRCGATQLGDKRLTHVFANALGEDTRRLAHGSKQQDRCGRHGTLRECLSW